MSESSKSWQARISEATDAIAQKFVESVSYDWRLYKHDIAGSIAHATMLAKVGLITTEDRDAIEKGLKEIEAEIDRDGPRWPGFRQELEDIHLCVEMELTNRIGEPGRKLHTGRSRNDQVAFDLALWLDSTTRDAVRQLIDLEKAFVVLAERSRHVVMPSFTHMQRAQPICAGAEALAWAHMLRSMEHISLCILRYEVPLGSGAIAGTSLPIDPRETGMYRDLLAQDPEAAEVFARDAPIEQLCEEEISYIEKRRSEFPTDDYGSRDEEIARGDPRFRMFKLLRSPEGIDVPENSIYHTATRENALDFVYWLARIGMTLSRWAEQWIIYMSTEFSFIKIADRYTTSSSMMPQKRNPDMLELIRGRCGNVYGDLFALMTILKGLPIGYNRDLQEDKRILFRAYDTVSECLTMAAAIVNSAEFIPENIEPTLDRGFLDATSLAEYLVTKGIPFRTAHHIVGTLVARCEQEGKHALSQLTVEQFNEVIATKSDIRIDNDIYTCLGARNVVKRYQSAGAAGGKPFEEQLAAWKARLGM